MVPSEDHHVFRRIPMLRHLLCTLSSLSLEAVHLFSQRGLTRGLPTSGTTSCDQHNRPVAPHQCGFGESGQVAKKVPSPFSTRCRSFSNTDSLRGTLGIPLYNTHTSVCVECKPWSHHNEELSSTPYYPHGHTRPTLSHASTGHLCVAHQAPSGQGPQAPSPIRTRLT